MNTFSYRPGNLAAVAGVLLILLAWINYIPYPQTDTAMHGKNRIELFSILGGGEFFPGSASLDNSHVVCVLGHTEIDIRNINPQAEVIEINVLSIMGDVQVKVPSNWQVRVKALPFLGAVTNQTFYHSEQHPLPGKTLVINGLALIGGIDVSN